MDEEDEVVLRRILAEWGRTILRLCLRVSGGGWLSKFGISIPPMTCVAVAFGFVQLHTAPSLDDLLHIEHGDGVNSLVLSFECKRKYLSLSVF